MSEHSDYLRELAEGGFRESDAARFDAAWTHLQAAYEERLAAAVAPFDEWRSRFRAGAAETARLVEAYRAEARFLTVDSLAAGVRGRRRQQALAANLAEQIDAARREIADPGAVPKITSAWIVALFVNRVYRRCTVPGEPDLPAQLPELTFLAISAYFGTEAGLEELIPPP